jgi:hypothetical protein
MDDSIHFDTKAIVSDILAGKDLAAVMRKHRLSERGLEKALATLIERGDLTQSDLTRLFSSSQLIRSLTWECPVCRKVLPVALDMCTRCGNAR